MCFLVCLVACLKLVPFGPMVFNTIFVGTSPPGILGSGLFGVPLMFLMKSQSHHDDGASGFTANVFTTPSSLHIIVSVVDLVCPSQIHSCHLESMALLSGSFQLLVQHLLAE